MNISVIGLGKLGLCTAACFAWRGHRVIGVDKNASFIEQLQGGQCPVDEPGLEELLVKCGDNLVVTTEMERAVESSEVTLVIVPTPSKPDGRFTNEYVEIVLRSIGPVLKQKDEFSVVDVVSTVMPGSCNKRFKPLLEETSGKVCGKNFGLVYNPEFIALGSVIRDFLNPDMVLIGASDDRSVEIVKQLYVSTCRNHPYIAAISLLNAEIAKLGLNCFVTMKISFANELASICEKVAGADVDVITGAISQDSRIGGKSLKAGLGFGGPCFPRDNLAFQGFAKDAGIEAKLSPQIVAINNAVVDRLFLIVNEHTTIRGKITILGLSYKPGTHIVEESQSVMLAKKLLEAGYQVTVHDPAALNSAKQTLGESVEYDEDVYSSVKGADAVVLMTNWPQYSQLDRQRIEQAANEGAVIVDSWREFDCSDSTKLNYVGLGFAAEANEQN